MAKITGNIVGIPNPITDYAQNDPTKADYIKNRPFKLIPDGVSIDNITEEGCYIGISKTSMVTNYSIYYVMSGFVSPRVKCVRQFMYCHSGANTNNFSIQQRYLIDGSDSWSSWEDAYKVVTDYDELNNTPVKNISVDTNIDDIKEVGCYATNFNDGDDVENGDNCLILVGTYRDGTKTDYIGNWYSPSQLRIANNYLDTPKLEYRKWEEGKQRWTDWEDIYATKTYVDTEIAKIEAGSGENEYFKILPEDADIDALDEEGKYIVDKRIDVADYIETITVRKGKRYVPSSGLEYDVVYQVREMFSSSGYRIQSREKDINYGGWINWQDVFDGGGGETWELLQSHEVTEEDGELENLVVRFPEDYKKFIVKLERTAPTASSNTIIYPYVITTDDKLYSITFWDYYDGTNASHYELQFSTIKTPEKTVVKMEGYGYSSNQKVISKPQTLFTSGWIDGNKNGYTIQKWEKVNFKTKLNVGSKYTVWGCK